MPARAQRLADVAAVGVGQPDVDDERVGRSAVDASTALARRRATASTSKPSSSRPRRARRAARRRPRRPGRGARHSPKYRRRQRSLLAQDRAERQPARAARGERRPRARPRAPRRRAPARKPHGIASWSGGGSNTCRQHRHQHLRQQPAEPRRQQRGRRRAPAPPRSRRTRRSRAAERRAPPSSRARAAARRSRAATNSAIAAAASTIANASSMWLIPVRSTVVIELTVCAVCWRMFLTLVPSGLVAAATRCATAGGSPLGLREHHVRARGRASACSR